ncbi:class II fructose-bisphosphate aldolase [Cohnella herbarum]|uniref:class II fructose-bisphosphate aldolase n=1 Tax=Cohnella herbarum TaxID=2728023 RepID=UPI0020C1DCF7|nr:class II fructose-bisphosphate aldolase [Cohnella herbarum]
MYLRELIQDASGGHYAIPAFNVFGYEDAVAVIRAAEELDAPVILATNPGAVQHMPFPYIAPILTRLAEDATVPVVVHLDHGKSYEYVAMAMAYGYTSVMFDGSQLPLEENIRVTREIVRLAAMRGISTEAEIGSVGYSDPSIQMKHEYSDPEEVFRFAEETGVDAVAVSIGTVHRMEVQGAKIDYDLLSRIEAKVAAPLVLHGSTGVADEDLRKLAATRIAKVNIGTALRMAFGKKLRHEMEIRPDEYDRIRLFSEPMEAVKQEALHKFRILGLGRDA